MNSGIFQSAPAVPLRTVLWKLTRTTIWMKHCDAGRDLSDTIHLTPQSIGCGIKVHISLSVGRRKKLVGTRKNRHWRSRQCVRFLLIGQFLKASCRIFSRDRSVLDALILEARQKWASARGDKIDIYAASEGSVRCPPDINENNLLMLSSSQIRQ